MIVSNPIPPKNGYPTTDGKPMAETELHGMLMFALIGALRRWYEHDEFVYVWGNLLIFYEQGNRRRHVSPDVFVVKGVPRHVRLNYLVWEEGRGPDVVIELTSSSTRKEDTEKKFRLYQDVLRVPEYFLFDPLGDYLTPPLQGYRLRQGRYVAIKPVKGRLPSKVLGLHLERRGDQLRLYDPATGQVLLTREEGEAQEKARAEQEKARAEQAEAQREQERARAEQAEALAREKEREVERLRRELEELRRRSSES